MSLLYNGNKEKRDPKEFKKLLADLESRRKKGVAPTKKQQVEELNAKNEEDTNLSSVPESSTKGIVSKEDSSNFDIQSPEEETQNPLSVQEKIQDTKKQQVEELNAIKSDINSEIAKQNKGISDIEDDLERMEQKMFHSQGGDKTSREDVSEYSNNEEYTEGFNLQGIKNLFTDQANEKTSNWIAGLAAGGQALWNYAKDGLFGDDKEETKEPKINVPPSPNDPDYEYKKNLYTKQHPELQDPESQKALEIQQAKEVQKSPENKLPPIGQKDTQDSPNEQKTTRVLKTADYYREVINDPRSSKLQVAEAKLKLAQHIQAQKNLIDMVGWESAGEEDKRQGQEAQAYLDSLGDISDIDLDFDKLRDDVEQEKANKEFKRKQLTQKEDISWWEKLIGKKETENLDPKLKKQIEDEELDIVEVRAIYNNVKNNPILNIEDKKFLENKIAGYEASLAQAAGEDVDSNKTSSTESQSKGEVSSEKVDTEISDVVEKSIDKANKIEKETKDNVKDVSNVNLVDEKKVSDVIKVEKENAPDPEIQSTAITTQGQNLGTIPDSSPSPSGAPAGGGGGAGNNSENKNKNETSNGAGGGGGGGATETTETTGNNLEKKEIDTVASDGTAAPVGGSSEINTTNGNVTNSGSSPESKVTPDQDSKQLAKQTSPEVKPDIVENVNNQKEIQTYYQKKGNFEQYDNANLNEKAKKVLGTT